MRRATGVVLRYDTQDPSGWAPPSGLGGWSSYSVVEAFGLDAASPPSYWGADFDGRFVYFGPDSGTVIVRHDTLSPFTASCAWTSFDITQAIGNAGDYTGMVFDCQYLYLVPRTTLPPVRFLATSPQAQPVLPQFRGSLY